MLNHFLSVAYYHFIGSSDSAVQSKLASSQTKFQSAYTLVRFSTISQNGYLMLLSWQRATQTKLQIRQPYYLLFTSKTSFCLTRLNNSKQAAQTTALGQFGRPLIGLISQACFKLRQLIVTRGSLWIHFLL